jgi:diguanylate cyclase (GGDEF)-like protein
VLLLVIAWAALAILAALFVVQRDLGAARMRFEAHADQVFEHVQQQLTLSQSILDGFVAVLGLTRGDDYGDAATYARKMLAAYPDIYAIEVVRRVPNARLNDPSAYRTHPPLAEVQVKTFGYGADRKWRPVSEDRPFYYPIVFLEPPIPGALDILGLDVNSVDFLAAIMEAAAKREGPVAGDPFKLVEGPIAFASFAPVGARETLAGRPLRYGHRMFAEMVHKAEGLLPPAQPGYEVELVLAGMAAGEAEKVLVGAQATDPDSNSAGAFMPRLKYQRSLPALGREFLVRVSRQLTLGDVGTHLLALLATGAMVTLALLLLYARWHHRRELERLGREELLFKMANFDALTGLPNRQLLADRMEISLSQSKRRGRSLTVIFADLNDFKRVNDVHGHATGDAVLIECAERLRSCVRAEDTVCRLAGDEFVIMLSGSPDSANAQSVMQKIQQKLAAPYKVSAGEVTVGVSLGVAVYPGDGSDAESLLAAADRAMYSDKRGKHASGVY